MTRWNAPFALVVAGALAFAGCKSTTSSSSNACGSGTPPSLVGTYTLASYTVGTTTIPSPPASGTLVFTATTYTVNLSLPNGGGGTTVIADNGTYTITGASCISETSANSLPTFTGSFTLGGSTLTVSGTAGGQAAGSVWTKTS
jgi:hypothetical protein